MSINRTSETNDSVFCISKSPQALVYLAGVLDSLYFQGVHSIGVVTKGGFWQPHVNPFPTKEELDELEEVEEELEEELEEVELELELELEEVEEELEEVELELELELEEELLVLETE